jgi:pimeloyl-ACP methyl ester carboxylesterase
MSYLEWDNAHPALHFAHANGFNAETYTALLEPLSDRFHVFASDARGHGLTTLPESTAQLKDWTVYRDDLSALLHAVHPGPLVLAGHSKGSIISIMLAAMFPARVRALVLAEPVLVPEHMVRPAVMPPDAPPNLAVRAAKRRAVFPSREAALDAYRGRGAFSTWPEQVLVDYLKGGMIRTGNGEEVRLACQPAWESRSFESTPSGAAKLAAKVRCPMTVLYAGNGTASAQEIQVIAKAKPDARLIHVPGATHFLPMEHPELVRAEIVRIAHA